MASHSVLALGAALAVASAGAYFALPQVTDQLFGPDGVPLGQLDLSDPPPQRVTLSSPDDVVITSGNVFSVTATGAADAVSALRFNLDRETLAIGRASDATAGGRATVHITMPAPSKLALSGPGRIISDRLVGDVEVAISGPGSLHSRLVDAERMRVAISGSGEYRASGDAAQLDLAVSGSGKASLAALQVDRAKATITGSGSAALSAAGEITGDVGGSARLTVRGTGVCEVERTASATLVCPRDAIAMPQPS